MSIKKVLPLILVGLLAACGKSEAPKTEAPAAPAPAAAAPAPVADAAADAAKKAEEARKKLEDAQKAAKDPQQSVRLSKAEDVASIKRRERFTTVYMIEDAQGGIETLICCKAIQAQVAPPTINLDKVR